MNPLINAIELHHLLQSPNHDVKLIDVRQPNEREIFHIGGQLIPLDTLADVINQFDQEDHIIFYCKAGGRSQYALDLFLNNGFKRVQHLEGGILGWQAVIG